MQYVGRLHHMTVKFRFYFVQKMYNCIGFDLEDKDISYSFSHKMNTLAFYFETNPIV